MSLPLLFVLALAGVWCLVIGRFSPGQILLGLTFGSLFVLLTGAGRGRSVRLIELPRRLTYLGIYLFVLVPYDLIRSNLDLARRLLRFEPAIRPGIIRVRLGTVSEATSALVAHAITMTPGQMVVDYSEDGRTMYVHLIDVTEAEAKQVAFWRTYDSILEKALS